MLRVFEVRAFARGNASPRERKVRTPQGRIPRENGGDGSNSRRRTVSQKTNRPHGNARVRVKRRGKSSPLRRQRRRQDKPNPVQGKIGERAARPMLAGMPHRRNGGNAETRFRGMNADAGTRKRPAPRNPAYSTSKIFFSQKKRRSRGNAAFRTKKRRSRKFAESPFFSIGRNLAVKSTPENFRCWDAMQSRPQNRPHTRELRDRLRFRNRRPP